MQLQPNAVKGVQAAAGIPATGTVRELPVLLSTTVIGCSVPYILTGRSFPEGSEDRGIT
jgi:hypothetical protein